MSWIINSARRMPAFAVAVGSVIAASAAIAAASGHHRDLTIHACYATRGGALRVAATGSCHRDEHAISWNTVGPRGRNGATGKTGAAGQPGRAGTPGTSTATDVWVKDIGSIDPLGTDPFSVSGSLTVPAGSYLVYGRASFYNSGSNSGPRPSCSITAGADIFHGQQLDSVTDELGANAVGSFHIFGGVTLVGTYTFASQGTLLMNCHQVVADASVSASNVRLTAQRVATLTTS